MAASDNKGSWFGRWCWVAFSARAPFFLDNIRAGVELGLFEYFCYQPSNNVLTKPHEFVSFRYENYR